MSVATLSSRKQRQHTQSKALRVAPENLASVRDHALTNQLYASRGLKANGLIHYWQGVQPTRIREWVTLTADDARIQVALDGDATGLGTEPSDWQQYTGDVRLLVWTAYHEPILELLRVVFRREWIPETLGDCDASMQEDSESVPAGFSIYTETGLCITNGLALFDRNLLSTLTPRPDACEQRPIALTNARAVIEPCIDEFDIATTELSALNAGSVIRLDNRTLRTQPRILIPLGTVRAIAEIQGHRAIVVGFAPATRLATDSTSGANTMSEPDTAKAADRAVDPATLPVTLRFIAGRTTVAFGALTDIAPGYVFELDRPLSDQTITILANEVPIAHGELVTLGDLLGVRISRLLSQP